MTKLAPLRAAAALSLAASIGLAAPAPVRAQAPVSLVIVDVRTVAQGYRASQLIGRSVVNDRREQIGRIDDLVVSRDRVLFAILSVGGFLGLGQHLVVAPYDRLQIANNRIVLPGATKAALLKLPEFHYLH